MINSEIRSVFPKHIYHRDGVCLEHLGEFYKQIIELQTLHGYKSSTLLNVKSTHLTHRLLHEDPVFFPLVREINAGVMEFGTYLGYHPGMVFKLSIRNMWANTSTVGGYNFPHTHPGSLISGAFYVKTVPENKLVFFDNYLNVDMPTSINEDTFAHCSYDCVPGRLVLFRSDLPHGNPPQISDGEKVVISFNVVR